MPGTFFSLPPKELSRETWVKFSNIYKKPSDIELFPGGMSEIPIPGAIVGPTFACIIGEQFRRLKFGDRYFFTHSNVKRNIRNVERKAIHGLLTLFIHTMFSSYRFSSSDLTAIRKRTLKDVICDNSIMEGLPESALVHTIGSTSVVSCASRKPLLPEPLSQAGVYVQDLKHFR